MILTRWSMFRCKYHKDDTKWYTDCVAFCSSAEGRSAKSVGIATLCWWCHTTTHGGDVPCHVNMFSHVMFTFVTPAHQTCRFFSSNSQFICDEWWISRFIRFIQFSVITPKIPNEFLWNIMRPSDRSSKGLESKNHWDLCYAPVLISMLPPMQERFGPVLIRVESY